ncbi:Acyl-CoA dehydrogenase, C-terminal domain [Roseovarius pacificus]|uniref:Acyl-CoA dehydrogenase, C-terminal domain n=1 Tax=Roseovarius pacificus TaxID=337701 RepID=A0A1M7KBV4_9RHOB|nr:hypothetical protein GCM10011315_42300 [Roseovarius pacificus]SHM62327.1 Acyl-CoA dehydrogenase, C-terminal domain [Roseovarius pacificus]
MDERKAFGKSINQFQALQFRLADMEIELQAARIFLRQAAWKLDQGAPDATKFCAMAKRFVTEVCSKVANDCLQLHGSDEVCRNSPPFTPRSTICSTRSAASTQDQISN